MSLFQMNWPELMSFYFVLLRIGTALVLLPWLGDRVVPPQVKILLSILLSLLIFPVLQQNGIINTSQGLQAWSSPWTLVRISLIEVGLGLYIGFASRLLFDGLSMGAHLMGQFMGLSMATTYDSHQESQSETLVQLQRAILFLIFFSIEGHHALLHSLAWSFKAIGIGGAHLTGAWFDHILSLLIEVFRLGLQFSAPLLISTLGVNLLFGVFARALPQVNVFSISALVTLGVGLVVLSLGSNEFQSFMEQQLGRIGEELSQASLSLQDKSRAIGGMR